MTLWVNRDGQTVTIHGNIGLQVKIDNSRVTDYSIAEHYSHLRNFWGQLGAALDGAEKEASDAIPANPDEVPGIPL